MLLQSPSNVALLKPFIQTVCCVSTCACFVAEIFGAIPASLQCHMLSQIAEGTRDILERCRLMTLVLQRYPDRVPEQGVRTRWY